jgi:hypothetical protein
MQSDAMRGNQGQILNTTKQRNIYISFDLKERKKIEI